MSSVSCRCHELACLEYRVSRSAVCRLHGGHVRRSLCVTKIIIHAYTRNIRNQSGDSPLAAGKGHGGPASLLRLGLALLPPSRRASERQALLHPALPDRAPSDVRTRPHTPRCSPGACISYYAAVPAFYQHRGGRCRGGSLICVCIFILAVTRICSGSSSSAFVSRTRTPHRAWQGRRGS